MEGYKWRGCAKAVAVIDLILLGMGLWCVIVLGLTAGVFTAVPPAEIINIIPGLEKTVIPDSAKEMMGIIGIVLWVFFGILALYTIIILWAAIKLLNGTEMGREPDKAHGLCATWRNCWTVFLILESIGMLFNFYRYFPLMNLLWPIMVVAVVGLLIRLLFLVVVWNFMAELKERATLPSRIGFAGRK
jgi:hypothetical protein